MREALGGLLVLSGIGLAASVLIMLAAMVPLVWEEVTGHDGTD
jgi:hypothetical protein